MFERAYGWVPKEHSITLSKIVSCETYERQEPIRKSKAARKAQEMEWEGGGKGGGGVKAGRLGRKGKGSLFLFPLTLFPATPPPLPLPFFLLSRDYKVVF